jgi:hypothetical protein
MFRVLLLLSKTIRCYINPAARGWIIGDAGLLLNPPRQSVIISVKYVRRVDDGKMERHYDFWILGDTGYRNL